MKTIKLSDSTGISSYLYDGGVFVSINKNGRIETSATCREGFSDYMWDMSAKKGSNYAGFLHKGMNEESFAIFLTIAENRLKLKPKERCRVSKAELPKPSKVNGVTVHLSNWWAYSELRRSALTLLMRAAGRYYDPAKGFDNALLNYPLAREADEAIKFFLAGNTFCSVSMENNGGFVDSLGRGEHDKKTLASVMKKKYFKNAIRT